MILIKTARGEARQVLAIKKISEFQNIHFKMYLMESTRGKVRRFQPTKRSQNELECCVVVLVDNRRQGHNIVAVVAVTQLLPFSETIRNFLIPRNFKHFSQLFRNFKTFCSSPHQKVGTFWDSWAVLRSWVGTVWDSWDVLRWC